MCMVIKKTSVSHPGDIGNTVGVGKVMKAQAGFIFPFFMQEKLCVVQIII